MATQIDYAAALAIFLVSFIAVVSVVSAHMEYVEEAAERNAMKFYAESLLKVAEREWSGTGSISSAGIGTRAYFFELTTSGSGIAHFAFSNISRELDPNSFAIYEKGAWDEPLPYAITGQGISFSTGGSSEFAVWFDDDSDFESRSTVLPDEPPVKSTMWQVEERTVVSFAGMQNLADLGYNAAKEDYSFRISVSDYQGRVIFTYGPEPRAKKATARKSVAVQRGNADIVSGEFMAEVFK